MTGPLNFRISGLLNFRTSELPDFLTRNQSFEDWHNFSLFLEPGLEKVGLNSL